MNNQKGEKNKPYNKNRELNKRTSSKSKWGWIILLGLTILLIFGTVFFVFLKGDKGTVDDSKDSTIFIPFIPVWVAIFVPLIARKSKEKDASPSQKKTMIILLIGTIILVLATIIYLLLN